MVRALDLQAARQDFERSLADLVGRRVSAVEYWDVHDFDVEPRTWDYGDWHSAVMGVELTTDAGPRSVLWTDTFYPYGVEVSPAPMRDHLRLGPDGPESWAAADHPLWQARVGQPIRGASVFWQRIDVGPGHRSDGQAVSPAESHDVPVAMRLDFAAGPVWFVAGTPDYPDVTQTFVPGDEIMVVLSATTMRGIGFPDSDFLRASPA